MMNQAPSLSAGSASSAAQASQALPKNRLYEFAQHGLAASSRVQDRVDAFVARKSQAGAVGKAQALGAKLFGGFVSKLLDAVDFREFIEVPIRGRTLRIPSPPLGSFVVTLMGGAIGSRVYYAAKRGKKNNDYREIGDVLRRDIPALTAFLFLLHPLTTWLNKRKRGADGLDLIDPVSGKLLQFSQLKNYRLDSALALETIVREGNGKGLAKAAALLSDYGQHQGLAKQVALVQKQLQELATLPASETDRIRKLSQEIHPLLNKMEQVRAAEVKRLGKAGAKVPAHLKDSVLDVVTRYGKMRLLPVAMLSLGACLVAIGWLPLWLNEMLTRKRFEQDQMNMRAAQAAHFDTGAAFQYLKQNSRLAQASSFLQPSHQVLPRA